MRMHMHVWQPWVEIEHYSTWLKNEQVVLIKALGLPQHGAEVSALFIAGTGSYAHKKCIHLGHFS